MQGEVGKYSSLALMQLQSPVIDRNVFMPGITSTIINIGYFNRTAFWIGKKSSESSVSLCSRFTTGNDNPVSKQQAVFSFETRHAAWIYILQVFQQHRMETLDGSA